MARRMGMALVLLLAMLPMIGGQNAAVAQDAEWDGALIASDGWRVEVVAAAQGPSIGDAGLDSRDSGEWLLVVADVTNWSGGDAAFPVDDVSAGGGEGGSTVEGTVLTDLNLREGPSIDALILTGMPAGAVVTVTGEAIDGFYPVEYDGLAGFASVDGITVDGDPAAAGGGVDLDASADAADELGAAALDDEIGSEETVRLAMAFGVGVGSDDAALVFGDALPLADALDADRDLTALPETVAPDVTETDGDDLSLLGSVLPDGDSCFGDEARDAQDDLTGGDLWFEASRDDESTGYVWAEDGGARILVNHALIAGGFADSDFGDAGDTRAEAWFDATRDAAEDDETGLWGECTGFNGDERPEPTVPPTPTPGAAEVRAEYPVLSDVREIAIRPGSYLGDEFSFSGRVFTVQEAGPGMIFTVGDQDPYPVSSVLQVFVLAPDGTEEAIFIGYDGSTAGIFEGTFVTIYGTVVGTQSFVNGFGGEVAQTLVIADIVDVA